MRPRETVIQRYSVESQKDNYLSYLSELVAAPANRGSSLPQDTASVRVRG